MRKGVLSRFICLFLSVLMVVAIPLSSLSSLTLRADIIPEDYSWNKITWDTVKMNLNYVADDEAAAEIASAKMPNAAKYDWVVYSVDEEGGYSAIWFDGSNWRYQSGTFTFDDIIDNVNEGETWYVIGDVTYTTDFNWNSMSMKSTTITCDSGVDFDDAVTIASNHIRYSSEYAMVAYSYKGADEYLCTYNYTGSWEPTTLSFEDMKECIRADIKVYVIGTETHNDKLPSSYNWSDCENCILDVTFDGVSTDEAIALAKYYFPGGQDVRIYYDFDGVYLYYIKWNSEENSWEDVKTQTSAMTKVINAFYEKSYVIGKVVELGSNYSQYSFQKVTDSSYGLFPYTGITTDRAIEFADYKINNGVKIDCLVYGNFNGYKVLTYNGNDWVNGTGYTYDRIKELVDSGLSIYVIGYADECSLNKFSKTDSGIDFDRIISVEEAATIARNIVDNPIEHDLFVYSYSEQSGKYSYLIYYTDSGWTRYGLTCDMQKLFEYCDSYNNLYTVGSPIKYTLPDQYNFTMVDEDTARIFLDDYYEYEIYNIILNELPNLKDGDNVIYSFTESNSNCHCYKVENGKLKKNTYVTPSGTSLEDICKGWDDRRFFVVGTVVSMKDHSISQIPDNAISLKVDAGIDSDTAIILAKSLATNPSKNDWLVYSATADGKYEAIWFDGTSWRYQSGAFSLEDIKSEIKAGQKWYVFGSSEVPTPVTPEPTPDPTPATGVEGFCERLYTCALGRASDPAGVKSWVDAIKAGADGAKAARGFFFSPEFTGKNLDNKEYVTRLYKTFMDREPDAAGLAAWVEALEKGASREKVFDGFVNSQEWANICFKYGIKSGGTAVPNIRLEPSAEILAFAERLYTTCLGRSADAAGLKAWADALANREGSGAKVARGFFFSDEFINKKYDNGEFVRRCYLTFMDREPDKAGYDAWVDALEKGASREKVFDGFTQSPEFVAICEKAGIIPFG